MATGKTPLRQRPYPAETDSPDVAADMQSLAVALDNAPNVTQGTLANRPTTGMYAGDRYYVTGDSTAANNGIEWYYTGSAWVQLTPDAQPVGAGSIWFGANDPTDTNWLICDGRALSRTAYPVLFSLIGTTYGAGDGSTTFNLPDLRQRFPFGKRASGAASSTGSNLGEVGGQIDHVHTIPGLTVPSLTVPSLSVPAVSVSVFAHAHSLSRNGGAAIQLQPNGIAAGAASAVGFTVVNQVTGSVSESSAGGSHTAVELLGSTDSDAAGGVTSATSTGGGSTGTGVTGGGTSSSQNPPYLTVNFIIRVS